MTSHKSKLRASCDACGSAKVKCDKGQPACRRCALHNLTCIYGVSRRTGRIIAVTSTSYTRSPSPLDDPWPLDEETRMPVNPKLFSTPRPDQRYPATPTASPSSSSTATSINNMPPPDTELFAPFLQSTFTPLDVDDYANGYNTTSALPSSTLDFTAFGSIHPPIIHPTQLASYATSPGLWTPSPSTISNISPAPDRHPKCVQEAYEVFQNLAFVQKDSSPNSGSLMGLSPATSQQRPLDRILQVNRSSSERLRHLLNCSCAKCPSLAMVYGASIWRMLQAYQRAVGCILSPSSEGPSSTNQYDHASSRRSSPSLSSLRSTYDSLFSGAIENSSNTISSPVSSHAPSQMSVGSFIIQDNSIRVRLSLQLLGEEVRQIGILTDLLAYGGTSDDLEQNLRLWVKREYTRTAALIQTRLVTLNP